MQFSKKLYFSKAAKPEKHRILAGLRRRQNAYNVYLVVLAQSEHELLEIYPMSTVLAPKFPFYDSLKVLGIATGKKDAMEIAEAILMDTYRETGRLEKCCISFS